jgi:hypothetical protein
MLVVEFSIHRNNQELSFCSNREGGYPFGGIVKGGTHDLIACGQSYFY